MVKNFRELTDHLNFSSLIGKIVIIQNDKGAISLKLQIKQTEIIPDIIHENRNNIDRFFLKELLSNSVSRSLTLLFENYLI